MKQKMSVLIAVVITAVFSFISAEAAQSSKPLHTATLGDLSKKSIKDLVFQLQFGASDDLKVKAARALADRAASGDGDVTQAVPALMAAMRSFRSGLLGEEAATTLAKIGGPVLNLLLDEIKDSPSQQGRLLSVRAVGLMGPSFKNTTQPVLIDILKKQGSSMQLKNTAVIALMNVEAALDETMAPDVVSAMRNSKNNGEKMMLAIWISSASVNKTPFLLEIEKALTTGLKSKNVLDSGAVLAGLNALLRVGSPSALKTVQTHLSLLEGSERVEFYKLISAEKSLSEPAFAGLVTILFIERIQAQKERNPTILNSCVIGLGETAVTVDPEKRREILRVLEQFNNGWDGDQRVTHAEWKKNIRHQTELVIKKLNKPISGNPEKAAASTGSGSQSK
jgi:hypothetical protein